MNLPLMDDLRRVTELADQAFLTLPPGPARILHAHLAIRLRQLAMTVTAMDRRRDAEIRRRLTAQDSELRRAIRLKCAGCGAGQACNRRTCALFDWRDRRME